MNTPVAALIGDGSRLHLQHGPIDLIIGADPGDDKNRRRAFEAAATRFDSVLSELVGELPLLRSRVFPDAIIPDGQIARRMDAAVRPHATETFVTRMAAVAGAVADEVLAAMLLDTNLDRAYVNNGGDIALHLAPNWSFSGAIAGVGGSIIGKIDIPAESGIRSIATSGQGGRSFSLGIADSVTVLGTMAAVADVAATLIANSIDLPRHPSVSRTPANQLQPDSDLGEREVVTHVGHLTETEISRALVEGEKTACRMLRNKQIIAAALSLRGKQILVGSKSVWLTCNTNEVENV